MHMRGDGFAVHLVLPQMTYVLPWLLLGAAYAPHLSTQKA